MRSVVIIALLAACGDNLAGPAVDAPAVTTCTAVLTGNVADVSTSMEGCPVLEPGADVSAGHTMLNFLVPSQALRTQLGIRIDIGAVPAPGVHTSETTAVWSAIAIRPIPVHGACVFIAGSNTTPRGSFRLELESIEAPTAHGSLALTLFVLPRTSETGMQTDCGAGTTEDVRMTF